MDYYKQGDKVAWNWGDHAALGTVERVSSGRTSIHADGSEITRNGTASDPAIVILRDDGTKVLRLASEIE